MWGLIRCRWLSLDVEKCSRKSPCVWKRHKTGNTLNKTEHGGEGIGNSKAESKCGVSQGNCSHNSMVIGCSFYHDCRLNIHAPHDTEIKPWIYKKMDNKSVYSETHLYVFCINHSECCVCLLPLPPTFYMFTEQNSIHTDETNSLTHD
jgi:hypothetical protein